MIDFSAIYELTGSTDQVFLGSRWRGRHDINGFEIARSEAALPSAVEFVRGSGECRADIIGTGFASLYLISTRLVEGLNAERISGWRATPVRFEDGTAPDGAFHALSVTGRCGPIRYELSEVVEKQRGGNLTRWWKGAYFDSETWDGSDIFTPVDVGTVFLTSRVRELLYLYDLDGVRLIPLSAVERMILPILSKGELSR